MQEQALLGAGLQIASAGLKTDQVELADGWEVDLDNDGHQEKILRGKYQNQEVVIILDDDQIQGKRTYVYASDHSMNGGSSAPAPKAIVHNKERAFYWAGKEDSKSYVVQVFLDRGGFSIYTP
jgi:hypothetical protein